MRGQAVHEQRIGRRQAHERLIHPVAREHDAAPLGFPLLPHAGPGVGIDDVGPAHRLGGIAEPAHAAVHGAATVRARAALGLEVEAGIRLEPVGHRDAQREAEQGRALEPGVEHVVTVAHPGDLERVEVAPRAPQGVEVGEDLAGVGEIGERVDHRHPRVRGQLLDHAVREGARDDQVAHAGEHARDVLQALAAALAHLDRAQVHDVAAQLVHADGERHPGAERRLVEHQCGGLAGERARRLRGAAPLAQRVGAVEQLQHPFALEAEQLHQVSRGRVHGRVPSGARNE